MRSLFQGLQDGRHPVPWNHLNAERSGPIKAILLFSNSVSPQKETHNNSSVQKETLVFFFIKTLWNKDFDYILVFVLI